MLGAGLVDMHSHIGVYAWPEIEATQDGNEMTNPIFPQVSSRRRRLIETAPLGFGLHQHWSCRNG